MTAKFVKLRKKFNVVRYEKCPRIEKQVPVYGTGLC
jgi:hypothetical protein